MAESKQQVYKAIELEKAESTSTKSYLLAKRLLDIVLSISGIILLLPVFVICALIIKVEDSKGTIFFKQERVGKNGQVFFMYKFRSMVSNAEDLLEKLLEQNEASGPMFKMKDDPRVTIIGKFLRRTSVDELPQLFNVLKGEMSLVGPRPALPREVEEYTSYEKQRLLVRPGLTCFWQVSGRSSLGFEEQIKLDLEYIETRSMRLDISLILRTVGVLLGSKDAY
ncbi:sugar transferase [Terribacillus sp. DMT04]|uniref:sugar transferase n=1 Tax=Terribacillus sp. DMT04 TaxID=2850441 RepID=UPI001C2C1537|nr:sugar transferase [Terribacillus sp. DMT04]QXE01068.1 sugar transferase [Terribacillus sp. DMT04]